MALFSSNQKKKEFLFWIWRISTTSVSEEEEEKDGTKAEKEKKRNQDRQGSKPLKAKLLDDSTVSGAVADYGQGSWWVYIAWKIENS